MHDTIQKNIDAAQSALWHTANLARAAAAYACARMPQSGSPAEEMTLIVLEDMLKTIERDAVAAADELDKFPVSS